MWNPLASLPPSNTGALSAYSPMAQQTQPVANRTADPRAFHQARRSWMGDMPERPEGLPGFFNPRQFARGKFNGPWHGMDMSGGLPATLTGALAPYQDQWAAYQPQLSQWLAAQPTRSSF